VSWFVGFSAYVVEKFSRGFPDDWRIVLSLRDTRFAFTVIRLYMALKYLSVPTFQRMYWKEIVSSVSIIFDTTLCLKKTTLTSHTIPSMHINRFW